MPDTFLLAIAVGAAVSAAVLLVLWLRSARALRALRGSTASSVEDVARLEVEVADRSGRLRIIQELHEVAAHRVSGIVAQADGARYAATADPAAAARAAEAIAEDGRTTLADLRRVMTLVREGEAPLPVAGSAAVRELLRRMGDAGLVVRFAQTGDPYDLSGGAAFAVHRILQEALENALQHGGPGTEVGVSIAWTASGVSLRVDDDGFRNAVRLRGLDAEQEAAELAYTVEDDLLALTRETTGAGIREMRARAELFGGTLTAERTPGVGFGVTAVLPTIRHHDGVHGVVLERT